MERCIGRRGAGGLTALVRSPSFDSLEPTPIVLELMERCVGRRGSEGPNSLIRPPSSLWRSPVSSPLGGWRESERKFFLGGGESQSENFFSADVITIDPTPSSLDRS